MNKLILAVLFISFQAHAQTTGRVALNEAIRLLGKTPLHGEALLPSNVRGNPCILKYDATRGGMLLGESVLATYELTIANQTTEMSFIRTSTVTQAGKMSRFKTSQKVAGDDSPDEGGVTGGFTTTESMWVQVEEGITTVRFFNGTGSKCQFKIGTK